MIGQGTLSTEEQQKSYCLQEVHLKFLLTGLLSGLPLPPFAIRMCPPLTTKNLKQYQPLLAVDIPATTQSTNHYTTTSPNAYPTHGSDSKRERREWRL
nr:WD repeat-containing protein 11-like [Zootoca vivipara]